MEQIHSIVLWLAEILLLLYWARNIIDVNQVLQGWVWQGAARVSDQQSYSAASQSQITSLDGFEN